MIRTVITPSNNMLSLSLPDEFVGRQIEVIAFTIDEAMKEPLTKDKPFTHFASEKTLAKDWLNANEDKAWQDL